MIHCKNVRVAGADLGGFVGFERTPLFTDLFDLLVLIVTPSMYTQRLRASPVWLLYNLRPIACIDIAIGEVVICSVFLRVELASA